MSEIEKAIEKLTKSPMYYLFLASRELFHSNFWVWLSTLNEKETIKLFSDKKHYGKITFKREHDQRFQKTIKSKVDLYISNENNSQSIAIENKVKDFPTLDQLDRIKQSFGTSTPELVLTTLFWSNDIVFSGWKVKTYKEISNTLNPKKFTNDLYYQNLIQDYKNFTFNLATLAENLEINKKYDFAVSNNKNLFQVLDRIKLWEGYQKMRASHLIFHFFKENKHKLNCDYSINHQKATINFFINITKEHTVGISIEDNQYRKVIGGPNHEKFSKKLMENDVFFDSKWESKNKLKMCSYKPKWQYQYSPIDKMISYKALFDKINKDFAVIHNNLQKMIKLIPSS